MSEFEPLLKTLREGLDGELAVSAWSVFCQTSRRIGLGIKDREVGNPHAPLKLGESCGAGYRLIWADGLVSRGYLERRQILSDPGAALAAARQAAYDDPDAAWVLGPAPMPEVELHDPATADIAGGNTDLLEARLRTVRQRIRDGGFRTWSGSFAAGEGWARLVTSAGLDESTRGTTTGWHVSINGQAGDGYGARRPESPAEFDRRLDRLTATAEQLEREAAPMEGGVLPVLLDPGVVDDYVLGTLLQNLSGNTVAHGEGHFRREQFGSDSPVLREDLCLHIDPLIPFRRGSYRFSGEGVPAAKTRYVENGRLVRPVLDLKYARRLGLQPAPPPLGSDTLFFEGAESLTLAEALDRATGGVLVLSVLGVHTQDSASGDFSLSAPQALRLAGCGYAGRVRGTISGNLFRALSSDELKFVRFEDEQIPGLLFPCRFDPS